MKCATGGIILESTTGFLTQSKYYSPSLNAAIFDGPIKIYFAQHQEDMALQLYCSLQKKVNRQKLDEKVQEDGHTIYLMLYPNSESFYMSFDKSICSDIEPFIVEEEFGNDIILGVRGPVKEETCEKVYENIQAIF